MDTIAFIGLGHMGKPMALNLIRAGHALQVYDVLESSMAELRQAGARSFSSSAESVRGARVVFTMLPAGERQQVERIVLGGEAQLVELRRPLVQHMAGVLDECLAVAAMRDEKNADHAPDSNRSD